MPNLKNWCEVIHFAADQGGEPLYVGFPLDAIEYAFDGLSQDGFTPCEISFRSGNKIVLNLEDAEVEKLHEALKKHHDRFYDCGEIGGEDKDFEDPADPQ